MDPCSLHNDSLEDGSRVFVVNELEERCRGDAFVILSLCVRVCVVMEMKIAGLSQSVPIALSV